MKERAEKGLKIKAEIIANNDGTRRKVINEEIKNDLNEVVSGEKRKRLLMERFDECMIYAGVRKCSVMNGKGRYEEEKYE